MRATARGGFLIALGIYLGIGIAIILTGPSVFREVASRTEAGAAFAAVLRSTTAADVIIGVAVAFCALLWLPRAPGGIRRTATAAAVALLLADIGAYTFGILPAMQSHRAHIASFDSPAVDEHRAAFDELHRRYVQLYTANLFVALAAAGLALSLPAAPPPAADPHTAA